MATAARGPGARTTPTSPAQFNLLIRYMERHGDLCHPTSTATTNGRIQTIKSWERLVESLNADSMDGEPRDLPRWKKVWSDLKNHTKKKAARLVVAGVGGGGGAAGTTRLTHTELRVLRVLGMIKKKAPASILKTLTPLQPAGGAAGGGPVAGGGAPRVLTAISPASPTHTPTPHENDIYEISFDDLVTRKRRRRHVPPLQVAEDDCDGDDFAWPEERQGEGEGETAEDAPPSPAAGDPWDHEPPTASTSPRPDRSGFTSTRRRGGARVSLRRALAALAREAARARRGERARAAGAAALEARRLRHQRRQLRALDDWRRLCRRGLDLVDTFLRRQQTEDGPPAPTAHQPLVLHPDHGHFVSYGHHPDHRQGLVGPTSPPAIAYETPVEREHYM